MDEIDLLAKKVWDYMLMHQKLKQADMIFVLGSNDIRVADRAAEIYKQGYAPLILCAGGNGKASDFSEPEAKIFSERIIALGVPKENIILEPNSTNTGENILFSKKLLQQKEIEVKKIIAVQKPYMERRTYATFMKQWPGIDLIVTSPYVSYREYSSNKNPRERFVNVMVGDLIRIREYPKLGFQIEQDIPNDVWEAGKKLVGLGYNKYIL
jgi:uncharacterized SAM-binding protein YcdF (DUF218 family)